MKPISEMTPDELRAELLTYRTADGSKLDRDGVPIRAGDICMFYAAVTGKPTLRLRVVDTRPDLKSVVQGEIVEILDDRDLWANHRSHLTLPTDLLVVETEQAR